MATLRGSLGRGSRETKSIRLSPAESQEIMFLSDAYSSSEAALMKKWVQDGIRAQKLDLAIQKYMKGETDLRGGAVIAEIPYARFYKEIQSRNIVILDEEYFLDELEFLADAFENSALHQAVAKARAETAE